MKRQKLKTKPPHKPTKTTRAEVSALYSYGIPQSEIAKYIGIDDKTLRKYYREELDNAHVKAHAAVGRFLYQNATGQTLAKGATHSDCVRAAMFWAKTRMGWRETDNLNLSSEDGSMTPKGLGDFYAVLEAEEAEQQQSDD